LILWGICDGRAGHRSQLEGLLAALAARRTCRVHRLTAPPPAAALMDLLLGRARFAGDLPDPDLVIGAGHATHLPLLCARRARGGRSVVLMSPSLPRAWFDLCIIPEHDGVDGDNVILSRGPLNAVVPAAERRPQAGLILVGGPSRHYRWDGAGLLAQIRRITAADRHHWQITDSPRTPAATSAALIELAGANIEFLSWRRTPAGWLQRRLGECDVVWVSEDSMSMVFEALSGGAAVGLLAVPARRDSRPGRAIAGLVRRGDVTRFRDWRGGPLPRPRRPYDEAGRCAQELLRRLGP
jgi:hypothetical protein